MSYFVYMMTNKPQGLIYTGVTNNLVRRIYEHKEAIIQGFTKKYKLKMLVYYEIMDDVTSAIQKEKNIKHWKHQWKVELIEKMNPQWHDLYEKLL